MVTEPTKRQLEILTAIEELMQEHSIPPTIGEVSSYMGMGAPGGCASGLVALQKKGLLAMLPNKARSMHFTELGSELAKETRDRWIKSGKMKELRNHWQKLRTQTRSARP
jgi:SOS-response transcriptional repressor LexA